MAMKQLLVLAFAVACSHAADPNFRNLFYQTTRVVQNQVLADVQGRIPSWLDGDFVRQNCASYGDIDGKFHYSNFIIDVIDNYKL